MSLVEYAEQELGISRPVIAASVMAAYIDPNDVPANNALSALGLPMLKDVNIDDRNANVTYIFRDGSVVRAVFFEVGKGAE